MRKVLIYILLFLFSVPVFAQGGIVPMKGAFLAPRTQRDSVLIGDQLMYGVELRLVEGTV